MISTSEGRQAEGPYSGSTTRRSFPRAERLARALLTVVGLAILLAVAITLARMRVDFFLPGYIALVGSLAVICYKRLPATPLRIYCLYVLSFAMFNGLRTLADETGHAVSYAYPIAVDKAIFGEVPTIWLQEHLYTDGQVQLLDILAVATYMSYFATHFIVAAGLWAFRRELLVPHVSAIVLTLFAGLAFYFLVPTAPPWLAAHTGELPEVFRIVPMVTSEVARDAYAQGSYIAGTNDVGAMPSLHTGLTAVVAMSLWRVHRLAGVAGWLYVAAMGFSLMYLGEHYLIDVVAGVATAAVAWWFVTTRVLGRASG